MTAGTSPRRGALPMAMLVVVAIVGLALRVSALCRPISALDGHTLPDDAWLALEIAKNIGTGHGPRPGPAAHATNGYQPLWVFLVAPIYSIIDHHSPGTLDTTAGLDRAAKGALVVGVVADAALWIVLMTIVRKKWGIGAATLAVLAGWATSPIAIVSALDGLETTLALLAFVALWAFHDHVRARPEGGDRTRASPLESRDAFTLGALVGVASLARIDLSIGGAIVMVLLMRPMTSATRALRTMVFAASGFVLVYGPWLAWSHHVTQSWFPVSGPAVRHQSLYVFGGHVSPRMIREVVVVALRALWKGSGEAWCVAGVACGLAIALGAGRRLLAELRALAPVLLFGGSLFVAYSCYQFGWWFFERYFLVLHLLPLLLLGAAVQAIERVFESAPVAPMPALLFAAATVAGLGPGLSQPRLYRVVLADEPSSKGYRPVGLWASEHFPPGTVIGSAQSGALAYYAPRLRVVNLDGVVDQDAFASLVERRHLAWIRTMGVEYVIGWDTNMPYLWAHSPGARGDELVHLGAIPDVRSWGHAWQIYRVRPGPCPTC